VTDLQQQEVDSNAAMMVETVRDFAQRRVMPGVVDRDREEAFPREIVSELGALDLLGGVIPEEYGGPGLSHVTFSELVEEMARFDQMVAMMMTFPSGLGGTGVLQFGTEEQKHRYLTPLCKGEIIISTGVTEPASGTAVADMQTVCRREGDEYVINGAKTWISLIDVCDYLFTFATLEKGAGRGSVCAFMIPRDTPGLTLSPFKNKLGFRSAASGEVFLDDVRVPVTARVGAEGEGYAVAMSAVETGRLGVASRALGVAQDCLDRSVRYARERVVGGQEIGRYQLVQSMITDMVVGVEGARAATREYARMRDRGERARMEASFSKMHASDVAMMAATHAVQIHGAYGTHEEYHVARHFRDAKVLQIVEGQNQLHRAMVAEYALGYRGGKR